MNLLLAFAPFIAFAVVDRTVGATPGLIAGVAPRLCPHLEQLMREHGAELIRKQAWVDASIVTALKTDSKLQ